MRAAKRGMFSHKPNRPFKIHVLNDIHIKAGFDGNPSAPGAIGDAGGDDKRYYYAAPNNLRNFVQIANAERPDLIVINGDICDHPSDFALFTKIWGALDPTIPQFITLGNHDFDDQTYAQIVEWFGYGGLPDIAGSKFNQFIELNADACVIILDATYNGVDQHGNHYENVRIGTDALSWLGNTLGSTDHKNVIILSHVGPHLKSIGYFDSVQAGQIQTVLDANLASRPDRTINWVFGHKHMLDISAYSNVGLTPGYLLPALVLYEEGRFTEIKVRSRTMEISKRPLAY